MGNQIPKSWKIGTIGELLVQLRLLEYGVQAAPPIKDSGNDLIAIKGEAIKFIQVKTEHRLRNLPKIYHLVAIVKLAWDNNGISLDKSKIWILKKGEGLRKRRELNQNLVNEIWQNNYTT